MRVSVCLRAILIPEYLDFHSDYSAPRSRIAGIYSGIYSYSGIYPKRTRPKKDIICYIVKVKPATSVHYVADVITFLAYVIFPFIIQLHFAKYT